jgi:hypothetical protein
VRFQSFTIHPSAKPKLPSESFVICHIQLVKPRGVLISIHAVITGERKRVERELVAQAPQRKTLNATPAHCENGRKQGQGLQWILIDQ